MTRPLAISLVLAALVLVLGCTLCPHPAPPSAGATSITLIERRVQEILQAAMQKDMPRLDSYHLYGPQFSKFSNAAAQRQGTDAARDGEHLGLTSIRDLQLRAEDLKIDLVDRGDVAVATFIMDSQFHAAETAIHVRDRSTLVLVRDDREWKILHEHFSRIE